MSKPHQIRIRGPWKFELPNGEEGTMKIPGAWDGDQTAIEFRRHFNWPAALQPNERVFLVFKGYGGSGPVLVNGTEVGCLTKGPADFEVTSLLEAGNELRLSLSFTDLTTEEPRGLWGDVALEIRTEE